MSHPLVELKRILGSSPSKETGVVVSVGSTVRVASKSGVHGAPMAEGLKVGDCVLLQNGVIQGVIPDQKDLPLYHL